MTVQEAISNLNEAIKEECGVCSLCGDGGTGVPLMKFWNRKDELVIFCMEHSPWYPISEAQRAWDAVSQKLNKSANRSILWTEKYWATRPANPLPIWCKNSSL